jgi:hypothetical protein
MIPLKMMMTTMKTMMMMMNCQTLPFPVAWPLASGHLHFSSGLVNHPLKIKHRLFIYVLLLEIKGMQYKWK